MRWKWVQDNLSFVNIYIFYIMGTISVFLVLSPESIETSYCPGKATANPQVEWADNSFYWSFMLENWFSLDDSAIKTQLS